MPHRQMPYQPRYETGERTAVIERDIYHLDARLTDLAQTVDLTNNRLHALSTRTQQAEHTLTNTVANLEKLQRHSAQLADKIPDLETMVRMMKWIMDGIKYIAGLAILAGAIAGGQTVEALRAIFG